ncbi:hypothetical protein BDF22DRAFT_729552 [Syncephalis plumigaleata]|nr:hypothetical protein BDF22DRAFT_729552 [Syncephalis plumigaleata]
MTSSHSQPRISYYYDHDVGNYTYCAGHPMKPHRVRMVHNLVVNYGLYKKMSIVRPERATARQMTRFHTDEYIDFLQRVTPETADNFIVQQARFNVGEDCPIFDGLFEFCSISAGGSIGSARKLNSNECDIAVNWAGASGFCYVNDIVLAILELLRYHQRVLYIDIDIHHGDGVEEAFYTTDRVMTCSFHKHGEYFPGTGDIDASITDIGLDKGKYYAVNVPLRDGMNDDSYRDLFETIISHIMEWYRPGAVVLQCGADSLAGDRLGCFNLSMKGHAACVEFMKSFNVPLMVVGGGGYTIRNVARAWTYETSILCGVELNEQLPYNDYFEFYGPEYRLEVPSNNMDNQNTPKYLSELKSKIIDHLRNMPHAPSAQMQDVPRDEEDDEEKEDPDVRITERMRDIRIVRDNELSDSEDEGDNRRDHRSYRRSVETKKDLIDEKAAMTIVQDASGRAVVRNLSVKAEEPMEEEKDTKVSNTTNADMEQEQEQEQAAVVDGEKDVVMTVDDESESVKATQASTASTEPVATTETTTSAVEEVKEEMANNEAEEGELEEKSIDEMQIDQEETTTASATANNNNDNATTTEEPSIKTETMESSS